MFGLRSLRNRLAVVFGLIVLGAIGTIYLTVTPRLQERLRNQKLERLLADARSNVDGGGRLRAALRRRRTRSGRCRAGVVNQAAAGASAEVLILHNARRPAGADRQDGLGPRRRPRRRRGPRRSVRSRPPARAGRSTTTRVVGNTTYAVVAYPLIRNDEVVGVAVFADTLDEVEGNVALIRRQILLSGGIALVIALAAGYLVARALSQRVGRLESAARKVAAGDFSNPIRADSDDELGPARRRVRRHAEPARPARPGAQAVHRLGVARAAHADLLARRLPRAARRRGPRRGDAAPVPRPAARPGRPHAQARHRAARPVAARIGRARAPARADRPRPARARGGRRVHARGAAARVGRGARARGRPDRARLRPRAGRAGASYPARQRVGPHARRHGCPGFGRPPERARAPRGLRPRLRHQAPEHAPHLRAVLHIQRGGAGRRPRPRDRARAGRAHAGPADRALGARAPRPSRWCCRHEARASRCSRARVFVAGCGGGGGDDKPASDVATSRRPQTTRVEVIESSGDGRLRPEGDLQERVARASSP